MAEVLGFLLTKFTITITFEVVSFNFIAHFKHHLSLKALEDKSNCSL
ncbi:MAG: hypothetical protein ACD_11C00070G0004 [uncultured bacterium]|nr:MAG: hypothetical protein ACD_11C00070G0004 [uncultured bacterium]